MKLPKFLKFLLKAVLVVIVVRVLIAILFYAWLMIPWHHTSKNIKKYEADKTATVHCQVDFMPALDSLGDYADIAYRKKTSHMAIFTARGLSLFVRYDAETYAQRKQEILDSCTFFEAPIVDRGYYIMPVTDFSYKGYTLKTAPCEATKYDACKDFGIVGFNDSLCSICYLHYDDCDQDAIAEVGEDPEKEMTGFIGDYFGWVDFH